MNYLQICIRPKSTFADGRHFLLKELCYTMFIYHDHDKKLT